MPRSLLHPRMLKRALQVVTLEAPTGITGYGQNDYDGRPIKRQAWILADTREVRTPTNEIRVSSTQIVLASGLAAPPAVTPEWRVTLPNGRTPRILHVAETHDHMGGIQMVLYT